MVSMAEGSSRNAPIPRVARWRWWVQSSLLLVWLDPLLLRLHSVCSPVFHCYSCPLATFACPIGLLANFSAIHVLPYLAVGTLLVFAVFFGSFVCGWACPFGFLQDLLDRIPTQKYVLPGWTGYFRFAVLIGLVLVIPYWLGAESDWFICRLCPAGALEGAVPNVIRASWSGDQAIPWPSPVKTGMLIVFLASAVFIWRPWCSLFCPLGAIYAILSKTSFLVLRYHAEKCIDCRTCWGVCHTGEDAQQRIDQLRCVRCLECTRCRSVTLSLVFQGGQDKAELAESE